MDLTADFFSLFELPRAFRLNLSELDSRFRDVQAQVHPDRFAHASEAERRLSMQWATHANEAYQTLKKPLERAKYLLHLAGHDIQAENNTAMPADFLMEQMEWREALGEATEAADEDALDDLSRRLRHNARALEAELARHYASVDALRTHPGLRSCIAWVQGKPPDFFVATRKSGRLRGR